MIAEARKYGIKLILSLANNYDSFGGKKQYVNWARSQGQFLTSDDDFFRNPVVKGYYKNHVKVSYLNIRYFSLVNLISLGFVWNIILRSTYFSGLKNEKGNKIYDNVKF